MDARIFTLTRRLLITGMLAVAPLLTCAATPDTARFGKPVSNSVLAQHRGGHAITLDAQHLNANLFDNQASHNLTGSNWIAGHAFAGASGVPTVIQNSGNNVVIQNATILNVTVQ